MSTVTVASVAALQQALSTAQSGDVIQLAAGSYSSVTLQDYKFSGNVTITSADPNNMAQLSDLNVLRSSGITISNVELNSDASQYPNISATAAADPYPFRVTYSDRITITNADIHGSLDNDPSNDDSGVLIQNSTNTKILNSTFHELSFGIVHTGSSGLEFSNNSFEMIRSDGIHGSSSNIVISNNYFTNFHPATGDHPDAIQFFDENGAAPHDILISGNVYVRGAGDPIEGVFMRLADDSPLRFANVTIKDNLLSGTTSHGITVIGAQNLSITNNQIYGYGDYKSWIWIGNTAGGVESNNTAAAFIYGNTQNTNWTSTNTNTNLTVGTNTTSNVVTDGGNTVFNAWLATHPSFYANTLDTADAAPATPPVSTPPADTAPTAPAGPVGSTPSAPTGLALNGSTDTGLAGDDLTKSAVVRIDGQVSEGGSSVTLYSAGKVIASGVADSSGAFSISTSQALSDGTHSIYAVAKSSSGAVSAASQAVDVTVDTVAAQSDLIDFNRVAVNKSVSTVNLSGTASDDHSTWVSVDVIRDGTVLKTVATTTGTWAVSDTAAGSAVHTYSTKATDAAGNTTTGAHNLVIGTSAAETVKGSTANDFIWGNGGYDTMTGGGGADTFVFRNAGDAPLPTIARNGKITSVETITDYSTGDHIDLTGLGHLTFGGQSTSGHANTVNWYVSGGNTFVVADVTGDNKIDMMIQLTGNHPLTANDFLLG